MKRTWNDCRFKPEKADNSKNRIYHNKRELSKKYKSYSKSA